MNNTIVTPSPFLAENPSAQVMSSSCAETENGNGGMWMGRNKCFVLESFAAVDEGAGSDRIEDMQRRWSRAVDAFLFLIHYKKEAPSSDDGDGGCNCSDDEDAVSQFKATWYDKLKDLHTDPQTRHYHTMVHLAEMFGFLDMLLPSSCTGLADGVLSAEVLARQRAAPIRAMVEAVSTMATFFHDAVYDATSSTNEEDSAELFRDFAGDLKALADGGDYEATPRACALFDFAVDWVGRYILSTKSHSATINGENTDDVDGVGNSKGVLNNLARYFSRHMLAFLDADMAVLAKESEAYDAYAGLIRKEYIHVPRDVYCQKRAEVLESFLVDPMTGKTKFIFATDAMRSSYESKAKDNLQKEIASLKSGVIPCEDIVEDGEIENETGFDGSKTQQNAMVEDTPDDLAPGWEVVHDPNSGREYYYNSQTGETSWTNPSSDFSSDEAGVKTSHDSNNKHSIKEEVHEEGVVNDQTPLPYGWTSLTDESSGRIYFYNEGTGETSWDRPVDTVADDSNVDDLTKGATLSNAEIVSESAPGIAAADLFAQPLIANDSMVSRDAFAEPVDVPTTTQPGEKSSANDGIFDQGPPNGAEDKIVEAIPTDAAGEDAVNPFTEEPPSDSFASSAFHQTTPTESSAVESNAADVFATPLPADDIVSSEAAALSSNADLAHSGSVESKKKTLEDAYSHVPILSAGWTELIDESSGRVYYYNEESGITSWDRPSVPSPGPPETAEEVSNNLPINDGVESESKSLEDVLTTDAGDYLPEEEKEDIAQNTSPEAMGGSNAQPLVDQAQEQSLPEGWEQLVDPTSGKPYYYCKIDGTTSWDRPFM